MNNSLMPIQSLGRLVFSAFLFLVTYAASANEGGSSSLLPKEFTTEHSVKINGQSISYSVVAGETFIQNKAGEKIASIWSKTYKRTGMKKPRPVTFVFSGGPGAAAAGLNVGLLGPRIIDYANGFEDDGAPPYNLIQNVNSILDLTDLVFIDPVGTGFSRAIGDKSNVDFWSMQADTESVATFIRNWIDKEQRWNSQKYLLGLSYGTTRAVLVAHNLLTDARSIAVNGLILHGTALDFIGLSPLTGNLISYIGFMPTMAAVAYHHGLTGKGKTFEAFIEEARQFSAREYAPALALSGSLSLKEKTRIAERFAYFTGLDAKFVMQSNLKVVMPRFRKKLLKDKGLTVGLSDGRYTSAEIDTISSDPTLPDPTSYKTDSINYSLYAQYMTTELNIVMNRPYELWNANVGKDWNWQADVASFSNPKHYRIAKRTGHIEVLSKLSKIMQLNQDMKIQVGTGYYDLVTPFFDTERVLTDESLPAERVDIKYYEAGHRMWMTTKAREQILDDLRQFVAGREK